jgi:hypothetical protein
VVEDENIVEAGNKLDETFQAVLGNRNALQTISGPNRSFRVALSSKLFGIYGAERGLVLCRSFWNQ